jgi:hypothetical protein
MIKNAAQKMRALDLSSKVLPRNSIVVISYRVNVGCELLVSRFKAIEQRASYRNGVDVWSEGQDY